MNNLENLRHRVDRIEPELRRTTWPAMTYMLIPSVLKAADELVAELQSAEWKNDSEAAELLTRITDLRANFKRTA